MNTEELNAALAMSKDFNANTKKMFRSCKFAAMNVFGFRADWEVWGDFTNSKQAVKAAAMWALAFKNKPSITVVDGNFRVRVAL